ncbi:MAG: phage tail protein I [Aliarcobacter sp.]|nr:phage tail protein I [Aliarcobacter sp.]
MQKQSLIPSFEKIELHSLDLTAEKAINFLNNEIQAFRTLANPLICDEKYLPFLAYAFKVDFWDERLSTTKKRALIKESILLHQKKGTLWAIERVLEILEVKAEIREWFQYGGEPYFFKIKLSIEQEFPHLNQLQKLIDVYKNVRSIFEIDFDLFLKTPFTISGATNTDLEICEDMIIKRESVTNIHFGCNYDYEPYEIIHISKQANYALVCSNIADVEVEIKGFNIDRDTYISLNAGAIANLHFGNIDSDVMHLPIPPIELNTKIMDGSNLIVNIGFEQNNTSDLFHLDYHKHYEAISSFNFISLTKFGIEFQDSGLNTNINAKTNITNVCFLNLNI